MLYNLSEFMTLVKEDIGIRDIVLPVDDSKLVERFLSSALKEFSVRYPRLDEIMISSVNCIDDSQRYLNGSVKYLIPKEYYEGSQILSVLGLSAGGYGAGDNMYMPNVMLGSADMLLESIADIKLAASLGSMMCHAPTFRFDSPNILYIYNGWTAGIFKVEIALMHDASLNTIPAGAFTDLRKLAVLDLEEFLYNKMKRLTDLDVGVGTIQLKIDNWESASQEKKDLLNMWDENASLSLDRINYF